MFPFPFGFLGSAAPPPELELIDNDFAMEFNGSDEYISAVIQQNYNLQVVLVFQVGLIVHQPLIKGL